MCKEVRTVYTAGFLQGEQCVYLDRGANRNTGLGVDGEGSALPDSGAPRSFPMPPLAQVKVRGRLCLMKKQSEQQR